MARYNTVLSINSIAGGNTISTPNSGAFTTLTGSGTVNIPSPTLYLGSTQVYYNSTLAAITLSTPAGVINGPGLGAGATTLSLPAGSIITLVSDGANYWTQDWLGGNVSATTLSASAGVNLSPSTTGSIDNITIGNTTPALGKFTTLTATSANVNVTLSPTGTGTVTINPATAGNIDNVAIGQTTTAAGSFSTLKVATNTSGLSTPAYVFKNASSISNGGQEANAAALFGMANAGGDISVFVGSDQTNKHGYIGAVNRGTGYVPFVLNPAGGNVGIGTGITLPTSLLNLSSATADATTIHLTELNTTAGRNGSIVWRAYYSGTTTLHDSVAIARINTDDTNGAPYQNALAFYVRPSGVGQGLTEKMRISSDGSVVPGADNSQNFGSATLRWANIYTGDLHLSNNGSANSIDGTSGDWTIQEGEENLYIINNKTGKKYQFILKEI